MTIVLVDDDPLMHRMLGPRLQALDLGRPIAGVVTADTPEAALAAIERLDGQPLAVVTDFNLKASMTGLDLLKRVRDRRPDAARVLFSGYSAVEIGDVSGDGAAHGFFEKPLRLDELIVPLEQLLRKHATPTS